jgi:Asp-tRNA(Asn)/Glu-tRNA(Gln) amidotransferase A subunit family amidase
MPCEGVLPRDEDSACGTRFDRLGVMARSIEECAAVLDAVANGTSFATRMSHPLDGVRVGIATRYLAGASPGVVKNVVRSARTLRALGAAVGRSALPRIDVRPMLQVLAWERRRALRALLDSSADLLEPATLTYLRDAERVTDADYETSVARCDEARAALDAAMDPFDIVLLPTTPLAAPVTGAAPRSLLSNTFAFNVSRQPAVTVPNGFVAGLPTGTMLVGRHGSTDLLLRAAYALQQASKYHLATPSTPDGDLP